MFVTAGATIEDRAEEEATELSAGYEFEESCPPNVAVDAAVLVSVPDFSLLVAFDRVG